MNAAASSWRTCTKLMCSWRVRSASINPLMPSPGKPKTTRTLQSIRRSISSSAAVCPIGCPYADCSCKHRAALLLTLEDPGDRADEFFPQRTTLPSLERDFERVLAVTVEVALEARGE